MGFFKGIGNARPGNGGVYLNAPGKFKVEIKECKVIKSTQKGTDMFVVGLKILESNNPKNPAGQLASWVVNMGQLSALGNVRGFLAAATGEDIENIDEDTADGLVGEGSPLIGGELWVTTDMIKTKKQTDFTKHNWHHEEP